MPLIDILEAQSDLERLVDAIEAGRETEVVILKDGRPVARIVAWPRRIGVARGKFDIPESSRELDQEIAELFNGPSES